MNAAEYENPVTLSASEAEILIEQLVKIQLTDVGSAQWKRQHEIVEKLNMQAHQNIQNEFQEFITDYFVIFEKVPLLIYDLLVIETWKTKVFPLLYKDVAKTCSLTAYMLLYHEATVVNLLEIILFNKEALLCADDALLDLSDYCSRKIATLCAWEQDDEISEEGDLKIQVDKLLNMKEDEQLYKQKLDLDFVIATTSLSLLRYITDHITEVSLSNMTRILNDNNIPVSLVSLMEKAPWCMKSRSGWKRFENGVWKDQTEEDMLSVGKVEGQVWLALYNLLVEPECQKKYEITEHRRTVLLRLRPYFQDQTLRDQLPMLEGLYRYAESLAVTTPPLNTTSLGELVEQVPEILDSIMKNQNWKKLAKLHKSTIFSENEESAESFASLYNLSTLEALLVDPKCSKCGKPATQRCSRCRTEWYCGRPCQVKAWKGHKSVCDLLSHASGPIEDLKVQSSKMDVGAHNVNPEISIGPKIVELD